MGKTVRRQIEPVIRAELLYREAQDFGRHQALTFTPRSRMPFTAASTSDLGMDSDLAILSVLTDVTPRARIARICPYTALSTAFVVCEPEADARFAGAAFVFESICVLAGLNN